MRTDVNLNIFTVFILLGVFQGLILSYFFITNGNRRKIANIYQGLLIFALTCSMFEEFLNETGYIVKVLVISNYAEPFNFVFGPLVFLYVKRNFDIKWSRKDFLHFIPFLLWTMYSVFHYVQPIEAKYNSYLFSKHPDWPLLSYEYPFSDNPLGIRQYLNIFTAIHFTSYMLLVIFIIHKKLKELGQNFFNTTNETLISLRNSSLHFIIVIIIFIGAKLYFGRDLGDYYISTYLAFMLILTTVQVFKRSSYFDESRLFMEMPLHKYKKSSLDELRKAEIKRQVLNEFENEKYHLNSLASLSELAKKINETTHHVSQVINEQLEMNFFELLAKYRINEAKKIIEKDVDKKLTIEEIAEKVGYNSKSAFNNAFKKLTLQTPSEFRDNSLTVRK